MTRILEPKKKIDFWSIVCDWVEHVILTYFCPVFSFYAPLKHQKKFGTGVPNVDLLKLEKNEKYGWRHFRVIKQNLTGMVAAPLSIFKTATYNSFVLRDL